MELKLTSTTAFQYRWQGTQTWITPTTSTLSSYPYATPAQIDSTGVYVGFDTTNGTFGDDSYFVIPSWYIEQFNSSEFAGGTRGQRRTFPERSYVVINAKTIDIIDADDNTLFTRWDSRYFSDYANTGATTALSSVTMTNGQLVIGTLSGLLRMDYAGDKYYEYATAGKRTGTKNVANRNNLYYSTFNLDSNQSVVNATVNSVSLQPMQGKFMMAAATAGGITLWSDVLGTTARYNSSETSAYDRVFITSDDKLYYSDAGNTKIQRKDAIAAIAASGFTETRNYSTGSTPAILANTITDIYVTTDTSSALTGENTIFVGTASGVSMINEHTTQSSGTVTNYCISGCANTILAGSSNNVTGIFVGRPLSTANIRPEFLYIVTNGTSADDGAVSQVNTTNNTLVKSWNDATSEPTVVDNDLTGIAGSNDGSYLMAGTEDLGVTVIQRGSLDNRLRSGKKLQGPMKRPLTN
jgi:hypothetical protein